MLSVDEATARVLDESRSLAAVEARLDKALGLVLAEAVASDVDSPPFDKALMDGYAIVASDLVSGEATLEVLEEIAAGATPTKEVSSGFATRIMTGAPMPRGADAVVMVERSSPIGATQVKLVDKPAKPGQNWMARATAMQRGEIVIKRGAVLRPMEIGLLAEVGKPTVSVFPTPTVSIVSTGNELVSIETQPGKGRIRNSNSSMLIAQCQRVGAVPSALGIALDEEESLETAFRRGFESDILLISGGVSAGRFDLAPKVLESLGATNCFRQVFLKPGKPLWFGYLDRDGRRTLIFGLPGNPVSSLVCFELFVAPAIRRLQGHPPSPPAIRKVFLATPWTHRSDRPTYHPASIIYDAQRGEFLATPLNWKGSADLRTLSLADGLVCFPPGEVSYGAGESVGVILLVA